ncbi:MAG: pilus assembly protein N-terminal domain-containing protein [Bryobacterales bacterium]|nr:pilus assembly protein N-terminal domain-containing protein [Bryobacterales bacterium]
MNRHWILTLAPLAITTLAAGILTAQGMEELRLTAGKSVVVDYPADISRISTSNPDTVDAVAVTTREILLHAKGIGAATVIVWAKSGQRTFYNVNVDHNLEPLRRLLKETFPKETVQVQGARESLSLNGRVSSKEVADRAAALAAPFMKTVINNLEVAAPKVQKQVMLKVKFAEMNRTLAAQYGVNLVSLGAGNTPGRITTGQFPAPAASTLQGSIPGKIQGTQSTFTITDALNIFAFLPGQNLAALVRDLQTKGVVQILAEPNLVTSNGQEANYLVGGEFPVPILQGGANAGAVTIQFKEFGNRLRFLPVITDNHTIKLYVKSEVSTVDISNGVSFSGFTIPALTTRRAETNVELAAGQSCVIAGLLDEREQDALSRLPGLANIPVLGYLFRSKDTQRRANELVVMVTPEIVNPLNPEDPKPEPNWPRPFLRPTVTNLTPQASAVATGKSPAPSRRK